MNYRELVYGAIDINKSPFAKCENCFKELKKELNEFFDYLDCNKDGQISAEDMYKAFKNMKLEF